MITKQLNDNNSRAIRHMETTYVAVIARIAD